jgi:hypothetical protein
LFIATHASILTSDFSKKFYNFSSIEIQNVPLPF